MADEYQDDFQAVDTQEENAFWRKEMGARVVQHSRLAARTSWALWGLLALSATVLLAIIIAVSVSNAKMSRRIIALEGSVVNFSSSVKKLQAGRATDQEIQGEINKLKVSTLTTESQLSLVGRAVTAVNELDTLKSMVFQVNCILDKMKKNMTTASCCPDGWVYFSDSCYYISTEGLSWDAAKDYCSSKSSSLVILNSEQEWRFVAGKTMPRFYWIGLTDERTGKWEWVDGTPYVLDRRKWRPGQPDDWTDHGLGGGEDCAHLHRDGLLNDDHCSRSYYFVCEARAG
nr:PREDICTED: C-type lectin domain family 10 member A-like [Lepisosteus oculatus]XP_015196183.1 PREDICTED: C-type lectin domain family 10 member A-like [Lepisosteus oculatus]